MIETREMLAKRKEEEAALRKRRSAEYAEKMGIAPGAAKSRLAELKEEIERSLGVIHREWWKVGEALHEIKVGKLYLEDGTWEEFCASVAGMSKRQADRMISGSRKRAEIESALSDLGPMGPVLTERVLREFKDVPAVECAEIVVEAAAKGKVTAKAVRESVDRARVSRDDREAREGAVMNARCAEAAVAVAVESDPHGVPVDASRKPPKWTGAEVVRASTFDPSFVLAGSPWPGVVVGEGAAAPVAAEWEDSGCPLGGVFKGSGGASAGGSGLPANMDRPTRDILAKLVEAADILLDERGYDGNGWEEIAGCRDRAKVLLGVEEASL